jgi:hypothetical protein
MNKRMSRRKKLNCGIDFNKLKKFLKKHMGPKCKEFYNNCDTCCSWKALELLERIHKELEMNHNE